MYYYRTVAVFFRTFYIHLYYFLLCVKIITSRDINDDANKTDWIVLSTNRLVHVCIRIANNNDELFLLEFNRKWCNIPSRYTKCHRQHKFFSRRYYETRIYSVDDRSCVSIPSVCDPAIRCIIM